MDHIWPPGVPLTRGVLFMLHGIYREVCNGLTKCWGSKIHLVVSSEFWKSVYVHSKQKLSLLSSFLFDFQGRNMNTAATATFSKISVLKLLVCEHIQFKSTQQINQFDDYLYPSVGKTFKIIKLQNLDCLIILWPPLPQVTFFLISKYTIINWNQPTSFH